MSAPTRNTEEASAEEMLRELVARRRHGALPVEDGVEACAALAEEMAHEIERQERNREPGDSMCGILRHYAARLREVLK